MRLELTRRGDYAVRAMLLLATEPPEAWASVRRIAEAMSIPPQILPSVMRELVRAGLTDAQLGRRGGYRLARPASLITLLEVVEAIEGDTRRITCVLRGGPCGQDGVCAVHPVFAAAQEAVRSQLAGTSLATVGGSLVFAPAGSKSEGA